MRRMSATDLAVRPAGAADAVAVIELVGRVFHEYGFVWHPATEVADLLAFDRHYQAPRGAFFVVSREGSIVGSVGVERTADGAAELHRLYLDPDLRGRGLGRALVLAVLEWCRVHGIGRLTLWSDTRFARAHLLYERMGFERIGERELPEDPNRTREYGFARAVAGLAANT